MGQKVNIGQKEYSLLPFLLIVVQVLLTCVRSGNSSLCIFYFHFMFKLVQVENCTHTLILPNVLLWIKLKWAFFDRFPYLFPETYLKTSQISTMEFLRKYLTAKIVNYFRKKRSIVNIWLTSNSTPLFTIATKKLIRRLIFSIKIKYNTVIAYVAPLFKLFEM